MHYIYTHIYIYIYTYIYRTPVPVPAPRPTRPGTLPVGAAERSAAAARGDQSTNEIFSDRKICIIYLF